MLLYFIILYYCTVDAYALIPVLTLKEATTNMTLTSMKVTTKYKPSI
jgi:hypothetical protein